MEDFKEKIPMIIAVIIVIALAVWSILLFGSA